MELTVRSTRTEDAQAWHALWRAYCAALDGAVSDEVTEGVQPVCYLEDLFVAPEARSSGAGRALIEGIVAVGRRHGWRRVYWHTHENNHRARTLYDRLAPRTDYVRYDIDL
jgi:GNAT superfamily N-acetyltransferase